MSSECIIEVRVFKVSEDDINWRHMMSWRPIFHNMGLVKVTKTPPWFNNFTQWSLFSPR